jgi:hypothetical protein
LSRNISKLEKTVILIVIAGMILGLGIYFIVLPAYNEIGVVDTKIAEVEKQIAAAQELAARERQLDADIGDQRERVSTVHEGFFDEITTTEAVTIVQQILANAPDGGHTDFEGIMVSTVTEGFLNLVLTSQEREIDYTMRELAQFFAPEEEELPDFSAEVLAVAEFVAARDNGNVDEILFGFIESPVSLQLAITDMLKGRNLSEAERLELLNFAREVVGVESQFPGLITAEFTLALSYIEYLNFLDYLYNYPLRLSVSVAEFYEDDDAYEAWLEAEEREDDSNTKEYEFTLYLWVVAPMYLPDLTEEIPAAEEPAEE